LNGWPLSVNGPFTKQLCKEAADEIVAWRVRADIDKERIEELESKNLHHTTRTQIANLTNHNISLKAQIEELESTIAELCPPPSPELQKSFDSIDKALPKP